MALANSNRFFLEHIEELRVRLVKAGIGFITASVLSYLFIDKVILFLSRPVGVLIFTSPAEAFLSRLNLAMFLGMLFSSPYSIFQLWMFVSTGLNEDELRYAKLFAPWAFVLFVCGGLFAYFIIIPVCIRFLLSFSSDAVVAMISVRNYISFVCSFTMIFAAMFQLPLGVMFFSRLGIVTPGMLEEKRRHAIVLMLIVGALITPSDVASQLLVAVPMMCLYEAGIIFSKWICRKS